jgi:galactokinase
MKNDTVKFSEPAMTALDAFSAAFPGNQEYVSPIGAAWAPGRVNLIGEHTDYNDGYVLPIAIDRVAAFAGRARSDDIVRLWSTHFQEYAQFSLADLPVTFESQREALPRWARYILSVMTGLRRAGMSMPGFDAVVGGDVPLGGGMSSSAALEVATVQACALFSQGQFTIGPESATLTPMQVAQLCQSAEHAASGVRSGILDQAASCLGQPGRAILIDCRTLDYRYYPFDVPDLSLVVIDTGVRRELAASAYNERRQQCEAAAQQLRDLITRAEPGNESAHAIHALRDITPEQFTRYGSQLPELLRKRAGYIIAENARVLETIHLLQHDVFDEIGQLLWQSHLGLRDEYEVSCLELDALVEIAHGIPGVLGARMLGGGFGGCTINLVRNEAIDPLRQAVNERYPMLTGRQATIDIARASGGPGYGWAG